MIKAIRYRQRFNNFKPAVEFLEKALAVKRRTDIERAAIIQAFEVSFELAWKLLKDYLEHQGFKPTAPREVIKQAYQAEIIASGDVWLKALEARNNAAHIYDEAMSRNIVSAIENQYFKELKTLLLTFIKITADA